MRRLLLGPLAVCVLAACLSVTPDVRAADLPFAGNWKVTVLDSTAEISVWLVKVDKEGKKIELLDGLGQFKNSKISEVKADPKALRMQLSAPGNSFGFIAYPGKEKGEMKGSLRASLASFVRIRVEKTEDTELEQSKAIKNMAGLADFQAALKTSDRGQQVEKLKEVLKDHEGKPITYLASQLLIGRLVDTKAAPEAFKGPAEVYLKQAEPYGHEITIGANLTLGQMLLAYDKTQAAALQHIQKAAELLTEDDPKGLQMSVYLTQVQALEKAKKGEEVKAVLAKLEKVCEETLKPAKTDEQKFPMTHLVASMTLGSTSPAVQEIGLKYARQLADLVKDSDPPTKKLRAYQLLAQGLEKRGKADEAKKWTTKIDALEGELDKEFEKNNITFDLAKFDGRKGKSERVALVELFTGAQCPPCVSADIAFDAALKTYKPSDVVFLQYHLHIPGPDTLTNADSEARAKFYGDDVEGTPTMFVDGKVTPPMGGFKQHAKERYESLREVIDKNLEEKAGARVKLEVKRSGDKIDFSAEVSELKDAKKPRLRFVLVEGVARYPGRNGQRLHHHIVRALPGGADGIELTDKGGAHKASVDLAELRKKLDAYLTAFAKTRPFSPPDRPMEFKKLKVVAFVQEEDTKKVLQATQADVPEAVDANKTAKPQAEGPVNKD